MARQVSVAGGIALLFLWGSLQYINLGMANTIDLASTPLFLTNKVPANILFVIDDSGSMDWEAITMDAARDGLFTGLQIDGSRRLQHRDNDRDGRRDCGPDTSGRQNLSGYAYNVEFPGNNDPSPDNNNCHTADDEEWRFRTSAYNSLYYNPALQYVPWAGVDAAGNPFQDMPVTAAKDNPYDPHSPTIDLTRESSRRVLEGVGFRYYTWEDKNHNQIFDDPRSRDGDREPVEQEHTPYLIREGSTAAQQNFANWFSYYRKRQFVTKAVYGDILAKLTGMRVGLVTFFNNLTSEGSPLDPYSPNRTVTSINLPLQDIDATPQVPRPSTPDPAQGTRRTVLDALYSFRPLRGTPLRETLKKVGDYLENVPGRPLFPNHDAYLPAAQGGVCQQSFVVMMTDGIADSGALGVGNSDGGASPPGLPQYNGVPYADTFSDTLGDVAMHYYQRDLRPDPRMLNQVPTNQFDKATHQHMVTYTLTFSGLQGTKNRDPLPTETNFWPDPVGRTATSRTKIDDLRHAAFNGRGLFFQAQDVTTLSDALRRVLVNIAQRTSSSAAVALNTGARSSNSRLFQARFDSADWSGQLLSYRIDPATGAVLQTPQDTIDAGALLDQRLLAAHYNTSVRTIFTYKPATSSGIPLRWSELDDTQKQALNTDPQSGAPDTRGPDRLDYVRGSNAKEAQGFRARGHRLGDIINSDPIFVGPPELSNEIDPHFGEPGQTNAYAAFRDSPSNQTRMRLIMVGSNDGMFHIFNANDPVNPSTGQGDANAGQEVLAYVPNAILKHTTALTVPTYNLSHRYFVDGSPSAADVLLSGKGWRTVVVSGLGAGGQGYFALDITNPAAFQETTQAARDIVLWEFTDRQDPDLGVALSPPSIVRMANGQWAAIFGNGPNNTVDDTADGGRVSTTGHAVFFVVFLDGPSADGQWIEGTHYIKIDTGVGSPASPNSLATPAAVDINDDFTIDYLVAGDLEGNLWRVDVTSPNKDDWKRSASVSRLFVATDGQTPSTPQPITVRPEVGRHPDNLEGFVVYFGTGKYLERSDNTTTVDGTPTGRPVPTQTFYGIWDRDGRGAQVDRSQLVRQTLDAAPSFTDGQGRTRLTRVTSNHPVEWGDQQLGFYLDFLQLPGERVVSDAVLRGNRIVFSTLIPSVEACSFGGTSFIFALDIRNGGGGRDPFFDLNKDRLFGEADKVPVGDQTFAPSAVQSEVGIVKTPTLQHSGGTDMFYMSGADGGTAGDRTARDEPKERQAWRKITQ